MGFFEKLGSALAKLKLPETINLNLFNNINIGNKTDSSKKVEIDKSIKQLTINPSACTSQEREMFESILPLAIEEKYTFLEKGSKVLLDDFREKDTSLDTQMKLSILSPRIPSHDLNIWRAALYLKTIDITGDRDKTNELKCEIMQKHGDKGKNIANLCTTNYLEEFLIPLSKSLDEQIDNKSDADRKFEKIYRHIVKELPFTVFVNKNETYLQIKNEIMTKKKYGFKFINIHGMGYDNISKIQKVIKFFNKQEGYEVTEEKREGRRIFAKITFLSSV